WPSPRSPSAACLDRRGKRIRSEGKRKTGKDGCVGEWKWIIPGGVFLPDRSAPEAINFILPITDRHRPNPPSNRTCSEAGRSKSLGSTDGAVIRFEIGAGSEFT